MSSTVTCRTDLLNNNQMPLITEQQKPLDYDINVCPLFVQTLTKINMNTCTNESELVTFFLPPNASDPSTVLVIPILHFMSKSCVYY